MNLSQDEINALLSGEAGIGDSAADAPGADMAAEDAGLVVGDTSVSDADAHSFSLSDDSNDEQLGDEYTLTAAEIDILGEIGNMCMGAVATTMYTLIGKQVNITTPRVSIHTTKSVLSRYEIPFIVVQVEYTEGIEGKNLLVLKEEDAALITDLLMGGEGVVEQPVHLDELHMSAISEIMNQMMGASATSMSKLLNIPVNISTPITEDIERGSDVSDKLNYSAVVIKVSFDMEIVGVLKSELLQLIPFQLGIDLSKQLMEAGMGAQAEDSTAGEFLTPTPGQSAPPPEYAAPPPEYAAPPPEYAAPPPGYAAPPPGYAAPPPGYAAPPPGYAAPPPEYAAPPPEYAVPPGYPPPQYAAPPGYPPQYAMPAQGMPQYAQPAQPMPYPGSLVDVHPLAFQPFDGSAPTGQNMQKGMDLIYNIPLSVSVELGKTKREISEILSLGVGTLIVLEKTAGDPVEVIVNGKLIARGEVVVIDDNYGVRITEIFGS